jgi:putative PIN family toxin of toxin-antitoxin system
LGAQAALSPLRVVIDTNVLVSALILSRGRMDWLRHLITAGHFVPLASADTARELMTVLAYPKFDLSPAERNGVLEDYLPYCEIVDIPRPPPKTPRCRDPADAMFLQLALAGQADTLVTGDADLLSLANQFAIAIVTPAELKARVST